MNKKTKTMVGVGLFTAIVVVLQLLGGAIRFGTFSISVVLLPIVVGSACYGIWAGGWLGFVFGVTVLLSGDANPFLSISIPGTVITVLLKGIFCGLSAGAMYQLVSRWKKYAGVLAAAFVCPIVNTGTFLLGCRLFFFPAMVAGAAEKGYPNALAYMIFFLVGVNFLVELITNLVLAPVIHRVIKIGTKE